MVLLLALLFLAAAAGSFLSTGQVKRLAEYLGCVDRPDARKLHKIATPRLGGLAIIFGFSLPLILSPIHPHVAALVLKNVNYLGGLLTAGAFIIALGIYDDLRGSDAAKKFTMQGLAGLALVGFGFRFDQIYVPGIGDVRLGVLGIVVTVVWVVGVINAVNFVDGMDGLATVVSFTISAAFAVIAWIRGDVLSLVVMVALAGSLVGFLPWNREPARIFMGDTGSLFIGLLLAASSLARNSKSPTVLIVGGPILALALPVVDTLFVMHGRFWSADSTLGRRISRMFNADRSHLHHLLIERYGSHWRVIGSIWLLTTLFSAAAVITLIPNLKGYGYLLGGVTLLAMFFLRSKRRIAAPATPRAAAAPILAVTADQASQARG